MFVLIFPLLIIASIVAMTIAFAPVRRDADKNS